jgi:hypothetical protein
MIRTGTCPQAAPSRSTRSSRKGMVTHEIYRTRDGERPAGLPLPEEVEGGSSRRRGEAVEVIPSAKMSKSKKNVVDPVGIVRNLRRGHGAVVRAVGLPAPSGTWNGRRRGRKAPTGTWGASGGSPGGGGGDRRWKPGGGRPARAGAAPDDPRGHAGESRASASTRPSPSFMPSPPCWPRPRRGRRRAGALRGRSRSSSRDDAASGGGALGLLGGEGLCAEASWRWRTRRAGRGQRDAADPGERQASGRNFRAARHGGGRDRAAGARGGGADAEGAAPRKVIVVPGGSSTLWRDGPTRRGLLLLLSRSPPADSRRPSPGGGGALRGGWRCRPDTPDGTAAGPARGPAGPRPPRRPR